jgi:carbon storage regulator CsrA
MLVITRGRGSSFTIGKDVKVHILGVNQYGQVKVGVEAPKDVAVARDDMKKAKP